jgi:biotin synthase-related radical SAM superfamily protein
MQESPEYVRVSLAAAMTLGLKGGLFYRDARLHCVNLLLTYDDGCTARCAYCGLSRERPGVPGHRSFIRVTWPTYATADVVERLRTRERDVQRVCISMITRRRAVGDTAEIAQRIRGRTQTPISCLISPTVVTKEDMERIAKAGVDKVGIAIDTGTQQLFEQLRGQGVRGPHTWKRYWDCLREGVELFGEGNAGSHFMVGLGETEREMLTCIQKTRDLGGRTHLFSFFPEHGSLLTEQPQPPVSSYRRIQLGRWLIDSQESRVERMRFDERGRLVDFGTEVDSILDSGEAFMTSGCTGNDGTVACNRPYANERPGDEIRNFPFPPEPEDIRQIREQIWAYTTS